MGDGGLNEISVLTVELVRERIERMGRIIREDDQWTRKIIGCAMKVHRTPDNGFQEVIYLDGWHSMLMRGKLAIPMHQHPFTLVRGQVLDEQRQMVFGHCLWLTVFGERCSELSLLQARDFYRQRYDLEHFFRFGKQRLLMDAYQTPETQHEENWWTLVQLAYLQLWVAREQVCKLPRPWERYLPAWNTQDQKSAPPLPPKETWSEFFGTLGHQPEIPNAGVNPLDASQASDWACEPAFL